MTAASSIFIIGFMKFCKLIIESCNVNFEIKSERSLLDHSFIQSRKLFSFYYKLEMALPSALQQRLLKRGLLQQQQQHDSSKKSSEQVEEVFAESYDTPTDKFKVNLNFIIRF